MLCRLTKPQIRVACIASYPNLRLHSTAYFLCRVKSLYFFVVLLTGCGSSRHPACSILGVTLTPCAEGPCETGCLALLPDISFFWKRRGPCPPVLESTYLSKSAPPSAGNSQRRRGRRWRKHRANVHLHSLPRIPRSPMPPAGGKTCGYTPQEGEKCG